MSSKPPISVVIPTLLTTPLLERAVDSCKVQGLDVEVVVVARGESWKIERLGKHPGVDKVIPDPQSTLSDAVNAGHSAASGIFRFTLDDDSHIYPGALARLMAEQVAQPDSHHCFTYGDVQLKDRVHITPDWYPGVNIDHGHFRTGNTMLWHEDRFPETHFRWPKGFPYFYPDYDFAVQMERAGCRGNKAHVVVTEWIPSPSGITNSSAAWRDRIRKWIINNGAE